MTELPFVTLDVFTKTRFAGNPLAIVRVREEDVPDTDVLQRIAREFNLSETVFLYEGRSNADGMQDWKIRIFTTDAELPFAGHPTIGTACYALGSLTHEARRGRLLCSAGSIQVELVDDAARAVIPHNVHIHSQYPVALENLFRLQPALESSSRLTPAHLTIVSPVKGMNFLMVELPDLETLAQVQLGPRPALRLDDAWNTGFMASYFYVVTETSTSKREVRTRMIEGSFEDPATGSAACALSAFLALRAKTSLRFLITQGVEMGRQSDIGVEVTLQDPETVARIELSGSAVEVMAGTIKL